MATTAYPVNSPMAVKIWARTLYSEALKATWASKFMGKDGNSVIQIRTETSKGPGDQVTFPLRMQLTAPGVQGDGTLEGNEESLVTYTDAVIIDQLRNAVRSRGKMSEQRVPFEMRREAKDGLKDWFADRLDRWFFNQVCGNSAEADTRYTGLQAVSAPDTNHRIFANSGASADESLSSSDTFTLALIDKAVNRAKTLDAKDLGVTGIVPVRPIRIEGADKYVMFLHPHQVTQLRTATGSGQWLDIQKAAMAGGQISKNPIYTGALGEYNGVILHEAFRVTTGVSGASGASVANVRRAVLCGAQAAVMAFGQNNSDSKMSWKEEMFDYDNQLGVGAALIGGLKKTRFNSLDFGCIVVSSYSPQPS